jgi:hypothetical protein
MKLNHPIKTLYHLNRFLMVLERTEVVDKEALYPYLYSYLSDTDGAYRGHLLSLLKHANKPV